MGIYIQLLAQDGSEVFASRDCPWPAPYAIKYGDKFYLATGQPDWLTRLFGPPFRIYIELNLAGRYIVPIPTKIWDAGGPLE